MTDQSQDHPQLTALQLEHATLQKEHATLAHEGAARSQQPGASRDGTQGAS